jgi:hypothetical protein
MTRDMNEENHMIGRNKNKNMLEQKPKGTKTHDWEETEDSTILEQPM